MTNERLKTYLDATKHESVLLGAVDRYLQLLPNDHDPTVIHPSEMADPQWCHRATWHRLLKHEREHQPTALRPSLIYGEGTEIHKKWQGWLSKMGILWGSWECRVCHKIRDGWSDEVFAETMDNYCEPFSFARQHLWEYKEVPLRSGEKYNIAGRADGIVQPEKDGECLLLEIKSIGPGTLRLLDVMTADDTDEMSADKFSRVSRPLASHFRQTQVYLRLANEFQSHPPVSRGLVIYEHKADQQVKEFVVEYNARWSDNAFRTAADIMWSIGKGREVPCPHGGCKQCVAYDTTA